MFIEIYTKGPALPSTPYFLGNFFNNLKSFYFHFYFQNYKFSCPIFSTYITSFLALPVVFVREIPKKKRVHSYNVKSDRLSSANKEEVLNNTAFPF